MGTFGAQEWNDIDSDQECRRWASISRIDVEFIANWGAAVLIARLKK